MDMAGPQPIQPRVIETASATTSPDNANSGTQPYLVVFAGLIALMLVSSSLASCSASVMKSLYYLVQDDVEEIDWDSYYDTFYDNLVDMEEGGQA